jgi:heptosyltransferase-2
MGAKAVGIFGPTTKELGFFPLAPDGRAAVAEMKELECRPCGLHGHHRCPRGHFRCMLDLEVSQVFEEAKRLLCP